MRLTTILSILLLSIMTPALAGKKLASPPPIVEQALVYAQTDREQTIRLLEATISGASPSERPVLMLWAGEQNRLADHPQVARRWWEATLKESKKESHRQAAQLGLALIASTHTIDTLTSRQLREIPEASGLDTQNADRFFLIAKAEAKVGEGQNARDLLAKAMKYAEFDETVRKRLRANLEQGGTSTAAMTKELSLLEQADLAIVSGDTAKARGIAQQLKQQNLQPSEQLAAQYLTRRIDAVSVQTRKIGVLLPLSGKYAVVGKQVKQALQWGLDPDEVKYKLIFQDTGETSESAVRALEALVLEQGVIAVVGPLRSDFADSILEAANALRVPTLSLNKTVGITEERPFVFQSMVNAKQYAEALVEFTMTHLGFTKFAIFAPTSNYGTSSAAAFTAAVEARGGTIVIREDYDPAATDLIPNAEKLGRKDYESRKLEFKNLKEETEESGGKASRVVLPPVVDFDAIFVPDTARRIPIACAALAYEEFSIGTFRPRKEEEPVPLLGLASWNNRSLLNNGGKYVRSSYFTDVYLASEARSQSFVEAFRAQFSRSPSALDVITYDAGLILSRALEKAPTNRLLMLDALHEMDFTGAVTGASGFEDESRETQFDIKIMTIEGDEILVVDPADFIQDPEETENGDSNPE